MPTRRYRNSKEAHRLVAVIAAVLSAMLLLGVVSVYLLRQALLHEIYASEIFAAELSARQVQSQMEHRLVSLHSLVALPAFRKKLSTLDCAGLRDHLQMLVEQDPSVDRASVTNGQGRFVCGFPMTPSAIGTDLSGQDWFKGTLQHQGAFVSEVFQRKIAPHDAVIALSVPLEVNGKTRAILVELLNNRALAAFGASSAENTYRRALLLDPSGKLVGDSGKQVTPLSLQYASQDLVRQAMGGTQAHGLLQDPGSGKSMLATAAPFVLSGRTWVLLMLQERAVALAPLRVLYWRLGLSTLMVLLLAGFGLVMLLRARAYAGSLALRLEQQNEELTMQAGQLQQTNAELHQQSDELANANEEMQQQAEELEQQSEELNQSNDELEARSRELERSNHELQQLREGLEATVVQRSAELKAKEAQFLQSQKLESIGRLAGGMAHDFNNLLTVIMGYVELLKQDNADATLRAQGLHEMGAAAERGSRLTHQLLAFARKQMIEPRMISLATLVSGLQPMLRRLMEAGIEIKESHQATDLKVLADPGQMEQVLMNLCVNARDAMPKGGVIEISTQVSDMYGPIGEGDAKLPAGRYIVLEVRDNGTGMEPEVLRNALEPFFTTKEAGKGSGLGLSMVHGAVRQAQGQLYIFSKPGHGSVFKIYLPAHTQQGSPSAAPAESMAPLGGSETIVLAEDNEPLRHLAAAALRRFGYTVLEGGDGAQALAAMVAHPGPVDLLISDLIMPNMGGIDLARQAMQRNPQLRVLFISGYSETELPGPEEGIRWSFLPKPFNSSSLVQKARECLDA